MSGLSERPPWARRAALLRHRPSCRLPSCRTAHLLTGIVTLFWLSQAACGGQSAPSKRSATGATKPGAAAASRRADSPAPAPLACPVGKGDCDGDRASGCEQPLDTDEHCGACGQPCPAGQLCRQGTCTRAVTQIAAGGSHTCARYSDGELACWGLGGTGQLGPPLGPARLTPSPVTLDEPVAEVVAGRYFTCVRHPSGRVRCFGDGGLLGSERKAPTAKPLAVLSLEDAQGLSAAANHTCAVRANGQLLCWGGNAGGQLGDGETTEFSMLPITPVDVQDARSVAAGNAHTCVTGADRTLRCWGLGRYGQLGDGSKEDRPRPVAVVGLGPVLNASAGESHTCAIDQSGVLLCWGRNQFGQLGTGDRKDRTRPTSTGLTDVVQVSAGERHTCAMQRTGALLCFGDNGAGQLGLGDRTPRSAPTAVTSIPHVLAVAAGESHTCALTPERAVHCFGLGDGQLGDGKTGDRDTPVLAIAAPE